MKRKECMEILSDRSNPLYEELHHTFYTNRNKAKKYFAELGYDSGYVLHHINVDCDNYEMWDVNELQPMTKEEHSRLHYVYYEQGLNSKESKEKAHSILREKYANGELTVWNKGLTKETDSRIKDSPRKGKTGEDFPFLCASKKGKSGGWNRGITEEDPRYKSLLRTDEQKAKQSKFMTEHNPMNSEESRKKISEKNTGRKSYSNGVEVHRYIPGEEPEGYLPTYYFSKRYKECKK